MPADRPDSRHCPRCLVELDTPGTVSWLDASAARPTSGRWANQETLCASPLQRTVCSRFRQEPLTYSIGEFASCRNMEPKVRYSARPEQAGLGRVYRSVR